MGQLEEVYEFDYDESGQLKSKAPKAVKTNDTRVLSEERDRIADWIRAQRERMLSLTQGEALDHLEQAKVDTALLDHRKKVRQVMNTQIAAVQGAATLKALDALEWSKAVDDLSIAEFPKTIGDKDLTSEKPLTEPKSGKGDDVPPGPILSDASDVESPKDPR